MNADPRAIGPGIVAGVDSSTQSCTVEVRDLSGTLLGRGRAPHPATQPPVSEQSVSTWWTSLRLSLHEACANAGVDVNQIDAISVAAQCHGLVALDHDGEPLIPVKLWNDTTSAPHVDRLLEKLPSAEWALRTGFVPNAALTVAKLARIAETDPATLARIAHLMVPHDWLNYQLTGNFTTDRSDASGTGYFDATTDRWRLDLLEIVAPGVDLGATLPRVLQPQESAGRVSAWAASELGLRQGIPVGPGAGDQHASAIGLGIEEGDLVYVFGTSGVVYTSSPTPVADATGMVDSVANATGGFLPLVCTLNAAKVTDTFMRILDANAEQLSELALTALRARARNDASSLPALVAYLDGERSPMRPAATGILTGITSATTREEVALAAFEGVVLGLRQGEHRLAELGIDTSGRVIATGGGAAASGYRQVLAEHTGRTVLVLDAPDATARGAAIQAATILANDNRPATGGPELTVSQMARTWAPPILTETHPITGSVSGAVPECLLNSYIAAAAWTGADEPTHPSYARRPNDGQDN